MNELRDFSGNGQQFVALSVNNMGCCSSHAEDEPLLTPSSTLPPPPYQSTPLAYQAPSTPAFNPAASHQLLRF